MALSELENLKIIIRAVILSSQTPSLSPEELLMDFKVIEGYDIPYRKLGFSTFLKFLMSEDMSDTVQVRFEADGIRPQVFLVLRQKPELPTHINRILSDLSREIHFEESILESLNELSRSQKKSIATMDLSYLKSTIRAVLLSSSTTLSPEELLMDFKVIEGYDIPYRKLGFSTFLKFLMSEDMSDTVQVRFEAEGIRPQVFPVLRQKSKRTNRLLKKPKRKVIVKKVLWRPKPKVKKLKSKG